MMTAESMLSKRPVLRINAALFFFLKVLINKFALTYLSDDVPRPTLSLSSVASPLRPGRALPKLAVEELKSQKLK